MEHLQKAFAFDIHVRRDVDEKFSADGIKVVASDVREGVVYRSNGVTVTAFLVDHAPAVPSFGYRVTVKSKGANLKSAIFDLVFDTKCNLTKGERKELVKPKK